MKFSVAVLLVLVAFVSSSVIPDDKPTKVVKDKQFLERQKEILELFSRVEQKSPLPKVDEILKTYNLEDHVGRPEVSEFLEHYHNDVLGVREIFSVSNERHLSQAIALFKVFRFARDYDDFYKIAVWTRQNVNRAMWTYSFSIAIVHRPDMTDIMLPPIYEVNPYYFFPSEAINEAQYYKQVGNEKMMDKTDRDFHGYTVNSNYSGHYLNLHPEQYLSYYLEDIGVNSMYYYYHIYYPSWMKNGEYGMDNKQRGALTLFKLQQKAARYYLERLANGMGEIPNIDFDEPIETPYTPSLVYSNGLPFPSRPRFANLHEYFYNYGQKTHRNYRHSYEEMQDYIRRIVDAADSGLVINTEGQIIKLDKTTQEAINVLGNLIEGNGDSINRNWYGKLQPILRHLLGYALQPYDSHRTAPSALEHVETSLRDPVYYQVAKKMFSYFRRYYKNIPAYRQHELWFNGLEVTDVEIDKLITYMDYFYSNMNNAVFYGPHENHEFQVRVRQERLNHKPFTYKLHVKSNADKKVIVKVFLGPKYDEYGRYINFTHNHLNFVEMEYFTYELKAGDNVIERNSHDFVYYAPDRVSGKQLYQKVVNALERNEEFVVDRRQNSFKWPQRFMLPKGTEEGATYQMFFYVYPTGRQHNVGNMHFGQTEGRAFGFPLERNVAFDSVYTGLPNALFKDVNIYYEDIYGIHTPHTEN